MRARWPLLLLWAFLLAAGQAQAAVHITGNEAQPLVLDDRVDLFEDPGS